MHLCLRAPPGQLGYPASCTQYRQEPGLAGRRCDLHSGHPEERQRLRGKAARPHTPQPVAGQTENLAIIDPRPTGTSAPQDLAGLYQARTHMSVRAPPDPALPAAASLQKPPSLFGDTTESAGTDIPELRGQRPGNRDELPA